MVAVGCYLDFYGSPSGTPVGETRERPGGLDVAGVAIHSSTDLVDRGGDVIRARQNDEVPEVLWPSSSRGEDLPALQDGVFGLMW